MPTIVLDALLDRTADLAVGLLPIDHPNLLNVRSYQCGLACVMPEGHPLARRQPIRPADLVSHRVIASPTDTPYGQCLRRALGRTAARLDLHIVVRPSTTACWMAQAGAGVTVVDRAAVAGQPFTGLVVRPFHSSERLEVRIVRNRNRPMSRVHEAFCIAFHSAWSAAFGTAA